MRSGVLAVLSGLVLTGAVEARGMTPPGLNHIYIVLDQQSFDAIRASTVVSQVLGPTDAGLPDYAPPPSETDRIFLRGRQTYLELFAPNNRFNEPVGKVGLGLAEDRADRFEVLGRRWRTHCGAAFSRDAVAWTRSTPHVPWYDSIQCEATAARDDMALWGMVYRPEFHRWQSGVSDGAPRTSREAILAPRASSGQGRFDITEVTIAVPVALRAQLTAQLESAGFARREVRGETRLSGKGWALVLRTGGSRASVVSLGFRTTHRPRATIRLGSAMLAPAGNKLTALTFGAASARACDAQR